MFMFFSNPDFSLMHLNKGWLATGLTHASLKPAQLAHSRITAKLSPGAFSLQPFFAVDYTNKFTALYSLIHFMTYILLYILLHFIWIESFALQNIHRNTFHVKISLQVPEKKLFKKLTFFTLFLHKITWEKKSSKPDQREVIYARSILEMSISSAWITESFPPSFLSLHVCLETSHCAWLRGCFLTLSWS